MSKKLFYILFVFISNLSFAQTVVEPPARLITTFPFRQLTGGVILVQARFNKIPTPLNFIFDTGSGAISIDSSTAVEFNIPHSPSGRTINGIAGIMEVDYSKNNILNFPGLTVDSLDFYVNNYDILTSVYGEKIDGIIGYSFFSRYVVKIDFDSLRIEVYTPGKIQYPSKGFLLHPLFTSLPIQPLTIKDDKTVNANFYIDTGAGLCFLMSKQFQQDSAILRKRRRPVSIQVQGLGGKKQMLLTIISEIKLGPYRFRKVPANILNDEYNATSYPFVGGVVGNDILRRFNLILNYPKREIHLLPNGHYNDEFDYSYTGMNMYYVDGKIIADDVIKDSPVYEAGLKKGDIILGVNTNLSNDISIYKNLMNVVGEKITLLVSRNDAPLLITFKVGRIY